MIQKDHNIDKLHNALPLIKWAQYWAAQCLNFLKVSGRWASGWTVSRSTSLSQQKQIKKLQFKSYHFLPGMSRS